MIVADGFKRCFWIFLPFLAILVVWLDVTSIQRPHPAVLTTRAKESGGGRQSRAPLAPRCTSVHTNSTGQHAASSPSCNQTDEYDGDQADSHLIHHNLELIRPRPRNMTVIMIGDSLMRYQYLSLAYFLRFGRWYDTHQAVTQVNYLFNAHSFRHPGHPTMDWNEFFLQSNRILHPLEVCDCFRNQTIILERRYFYDRQRHNKLVFINLNGNQMTQVGRLHLYGRLINASDIFPNFANYLALELTASATNLSKRKLLWDHRTWGAVLQYHVDGLLSTSAGETVALNTSDPISVVLMNAGRHPHNFMQSSAQNDLLVALNKTAALRSAKVLWKTTSLSQSELLQRTQPKQLEKPRHGTVVRSPSDDIMCGLLQGCVDVDWLQDISPSWYVDNEHLKEPIYRIINEEFLELIQALPQKYNKLNRSVVWRVRTDFR